MKTWRRQIMKTRVETGDEDMVEIEHKDMGETGDEDMVETRHGEDTGRDRTRGHGLRQNMKT